MSLAAMRGLKELNSAFLVGCIKLQFAVLCSLPSLAAAQNLNRNYHDEDGGGGSWAEVAIMFLMMALIVWWAKNPDKKQIEEERERAEKRASEREYATALRKEQATALKEEKQKDPVEVAKRDFYRRNYEASKLVYAEPRYVQIFNKYPEARRNEHLAEIAGFIDELADIEKFIETLRAMHPDERDPFLEELQSRVDRKVELLLRVYRDLG